MSEEQYCPPQLLALATEALRVTRTSNCTLFALPEPDSEWGFVPESFLGSADWMFSIDGIKRSGISDSAFKLVTEMLKSQQVSGVDLKSMTRNFMANQTEMVVVFEILKVFFDQVPQLKQIVKVLAKPLGYYDFEIARVD